MELKNIIKKRKLNYFWWFIFVKIIFLALTPVFFKMMNFAFIFHSFFWGVITLTILWWGFWVIFALLFGRIGCGWVCPFGTIFDFTSEVSILDIRQKKPLWFLRIFMVIVFFTLCLIFLFINLKTNKISSIKFSPFYLDQVFDDHYKLVWFLDILGVTVFGLIFGRRIICRNFCFMGCIIAMASIFQRHIIICDKNKCTLCGRCENVCPGGVRLLYYINEKNGLIADTECLKCGKCIDICSSKALSFSFVINRKKFLNGGK